MAHPEKDDRPISLLLLPALPFPLKRSTVRTAYNQTFDMVLRKITPSDQTVARLDVIMAIPADRSSRSRSDLYPEVHRILQEVYTLICVSAARTGTELDFPGGVDARIILAFTPTGSPASPREPDQSSLILSGPVVDYETLAHSKRPFRTVYGVEGESGEFLIQSFLKMWRSKPNPPVEVHRLPRGPSMSVARSNPERSSAASEPTTPHTSVAVGGTFDHLHIGHKLLLTATAFVPDPASASPSAEQSNHRKITVGITGDALLVNKKHASVLESWDTRCASTASFLESILVFHPDTPSTRNVEYIDNPGPNGKIVRAVYTAGQPRDESITINYTHIEDPFGPTITDEDISALIISAETRAGGKAVNDKRKEKGWNELVIFEVGVLDAGSLTSSDGSEDDDKEEIEVDKEAEKNGFESKISSTEIRRRLADKKEQPQQQRQQQQRDADARTGVGGGKL